MSKFLLLIVLAVAVWWLAKGFRRNKAQKKGATEAAPEQMVNCSHCGLYLPRSEAIAAADKFYCSPEHRRLAN